MGKWLLVAVAALVPVVALVFEHVGNVRISERHHSHHDTYVVSVEFTRSLVLAMTFMAVLGLLVAWLSGTGYAATDELHQWFVAARSAMWQDVCLDSAGVLAGTLTAAAALALWIFIARKRRKTSA